MADRLEFSRYTEEPDLDGMGPAALREALAAVRAQIEALDMEEPEDMESEAYEDWGDRHEVLEDLAEELRDRLDELED